MLVVGSDSAGKQIALALRKSVGTSKSDRRFSFRRYGFNRATESFWAEVDPQWRKRLTPPQSYVRFDTLSDEDWSSALSIGESYMMTSALQVSRFTQGVGNNGSVCAPVARNACAKSRRAGAADGVVALPLALWRKRLQGKLASVRYDGLQSSVGTATRIASALPGIGWAIGGKTGTGSRAGGADERTGRMVRGFGFRLPGQSPLHCGHLCEARRTGRREFSAPSYRQLARFVTDGITHE